MKVLAVAVLCLLFVSSSLAFTSGINSVVSSLAEFQSPGGGFQGYRDGETTLESTSQALFLSSLFGVRDKINSGDAATFVQSLANSDHGFGNKNGLPSDVESVRNALLSYTHLGLPISNGEKIATYIISLFDQNSNLFAPSVGGTADLKSTALAFQSLGFLNKLQSQDVTSKFDAIKKHLETLKKSKDGVSYFSLITADNYFAIVVGSYVGFDFGDGEEWAAYFYSRQVAAGPYAGGFFSDSEFKDATIEDTSYAVSALKVLEKATETENLVDETDIKSLLDFVTQFPKNLAAAAYAFKAISQTTALRALYKVSPQYDVVDSRFKLVGSRIIQGTQVKLAISVKTPYGLPHAGLDVSATITQIATKEKTTRKLAWNADAQVYTTDEVFDASDKLGEVTFEYVLRWRVADLGADDLVLSVKDLKTVGYDLTVVSKAFHAGKEVEPGSEIGIGTEFSFEVRLGTTKQPKPSLLQGEFEVEFEVTDSSGHKILSDKFDARTNSAPISFKYTLSKENIPGGDVMFSFGVKNEKGVHTVSNVIYRLPVKMVASNISFKGITGAPKYKIGDTVKVQMTPASLPDLRTLHYYSPKDEAGNDIRRNFFMDISSAETGITLFSLRGTSSVSEDQKNQVFNFELPVEGTFSAIGTHVISFHYQTINQKKIPLHNYDSATNALFEDSVRLNYTVDAHLHVTDLTNPPTGGDLVYGNEVKFTFKVQDSLSKKLLWVTGPNNRVALVLRHEASDGKSLTSNVQPAVQIPGSDELPDHFEITWSVNPNAVKGNGVIELVVQGNDGKEIPLLEANSQERYRVNVVIGGKIDVSEKTYSNQIDESETIFFTEVALTCAGKELNGADLKATVKRVGSDGKAVRIATLPVTYSGEGGLYQVSWILSNADAVTGQYTVAFYRQVDRKIFAQQNPTATADELDSAVSSLFSVQISHTKQTTNILPFKTEFLVLTIFTVSFFWTSFKKMDIEGLRKSGKKKSA